MLLCDCIKEVIDAYSIDILLSKESFFANVKKLFLGWKDNKSDYFDDKNIFEAFKRNTPESILGEYYQIANMDMPDRLKKVESVIHFFREKQYLDSSFSEGIAYAIYRGLFPEEIIMKHRKN